MRRSFLNVFCAVAVLAAIILTLAACGGDKKGQTTAAFDAENAFSAPAFGGKIRGNAFGHKFLGGFYVFRPAAECRNKDVHL